MEFECVWSYSVIDEINKEAQLLLTGRATVLSLKPSNVAYSLALTQGMPNNNNNMLFGNVQNRKQQKNL